MNSKKMAVLIIGFLLFLSAIDAQAQEKPRMTLSYTSKVRPGQLVEIKVTISLEAGHFRITCKGDVYIDTAKMGAAETQYISVIEGSKAIPGKLLKEGDKADVVLVIKFSESTPPGKYVVPITMKGNIQACPNTTPFEIIDYAVFLIEREPTNVGLEAWFVNPCGVCVLPEQIANGRPGTKVYLPHMVQNRGSSRDTIQVSAKSEKGWKVAIYKDENKNQILDKTETTVISQTDPLGPDEEQFIILVLEIPESAPMDASDVVTLTGSSSVTPRCTHSVADNIKVKDAPSTVKPTNISTCVDLLSGEFVLQMGSCYVDSCLTYTIPVRLRAQVKNFGPTEITDVYVKFTARNIVVTGIEESFFVASRMEANDVAFKEVDATIQKMPPLGTYLIDVQMTYKDKYGTPGNLLKQLIVKTDNTGKALYEQAESYYKDGNYESALEMYIKALIYYRNGNFLEMVDDIERKVELLKAERLFITSFTIQDRNQANAMLLQAADFYNGIGNEEMYNLISGILQGKYGTPENQGNPYITPTPGETLPPQIVETKAMPTWVYAIIVLLVLLSLALFGTIFWMYRKIEG